MRLNGTQLLRAMEYEIPVYVVAIRDDKLSGPATYYRMVLPFFDEEQEAIAASISLNKRHPYPTYPYISARLGKNKKRWTVVVGGHVFPSRNHAPFF